MEYGVTLHNPSNELSFYSISYLVSDMGIEDTLEGPIQGTSKDILLNIDTSSLEPGDYELRIDIRTGRDLEHSQTRDYIIHVQKPGTRYLSIVIICAILIPILIIFFRMTYF